MLVLTRKLGQKVTIAEHVHVTLVDVAGNQVRLGIEAPKEVTVDREEIRRRRQGAGGKAEQAASAQAGQDPIRAVARGSGPALPEPRPRVS
jgi:carbon storage regulator